MAIEAITNSNFESQLAVADKLILLDFWNIDDYLHKGNFVERELDIQKALANNNK